MEKKNARGNAIKMIKHKICQNCGAVMIYDYIEERFKCLACGNAEPSKEELKNTRCSYLD